MQTAAVVEHISHWLKDYLEASGLEGFVIGVSGGIDSAVTATLGALTGAPVLCLEMPIHQEITQDQRASAYVKDLQQRFPNVSGLRIDLTDAFEATRKSFPPTDSANLGLALANTRSRLRMLSLYHFATINKRLVLGTGNKVEDFGVGFYTKYGDGGVDLSPIADLMKTEVYELGKYLGVSKEILEAAPTDGLWNDDRTDESQMGATYPELEWAMQQVAKGAQAGDFSGRNREVFEIYARLNRANQHKMRPIPVCVIPENLQ
jgi:NAD+ synthase